MPNDTIHDLPTSNVLAWSTHAANVASVAEEESVADTDEPPDERQACPTRSPAPERFQKSTVRRRANYHASLLTKAFQSNSEDDLFDYHSDRFTSRRRRSLTSDISIASADGTCDTGLTTPARTNSPSPRLVQTGFVSDALGHVDSETPLGIQIKVEGPAGEPRKEEKRRCISFACAAKPQPQKAGETLPPRKLALNEAPKRPSIKFACAAGPTAQQPQQSRAAQRPRPGTPPLSALSVGKASLKTSRKHRSPSATSRSARSLTPQRSPNSPAATRWRSYLSADSKDLQTESSRFHVFARDEIQEDDWILQDESQSRRRLTIEDTLQMEMAIRRLGKEAEEEAEQEEAEEEAQEDDGGDDEDDDAEAETVDHDDLDNFEDDDEPEGVNFADAHSGYGSGNDSSEGYHTDEEIGFADSDDEEDDDLVLWSIRHSSDTKITVESFQRRTSFGEFSDSSAYSAGHVARGRSKPNKMYPRSVKRPQTPELPDSTDFVCGTLDEDRPLEEAYMSCMAAKKREKLRLIPQDIDPSFPTSEPDDEGDESFKPMRRNNSDEHVWVHGDIEGLDMEEDRADRRKQKSDSPKRYHSPPPKRRHSPLPPKARGRSPRRLFDQNSPTRRLQSPPAPRSTASDAASPAQADASRLAFKTLAFRPGLTHTKSLPRAPAMFPFMRAPQTNHHHRRGKPSNASSMTDKGKHVRGAIDIVKGLEQRRQRRREKFKEKQCNRARRGLAQEKRPQPGKGAERMRELGLLMAGKIGPGNYVLSC